MTLKGYAVSGWAGLFAPRATPAAVRDKLEADLGEAMTAPEAAERYATLGFEAPGLTSQEFAALIRRETDAWASVIRTANFALD